MDITLREHYNKLNKISEYFKSIGFETILYDVNKDIPIPTLAIGIQEDYKGEPMEIDMLISPFLEDEMPNTLFVQLSSELNVKINQDNFSDVLILVNEINSILLLGHFAIINNSVCYKYTCPIPKALDIVNDSFIESFTVLSLLITNFNEIICKTASGIYSLNEALDKTKTINN